jgi:hypothetical protein
VDDRPGALAPAVPAGGLEAGLGVGVAAEHALVALPHPGLQRGELRLELERLLAAAEDVVAQAHLALPRRALVVERHARALGQHDLAAVHGGLAGEHPQQRRLARAVAPGDRQPVAALELERDAAQQRLARHVLGEV